MAWPVQWRFRRPSCSPWPTHPTSEGANAPRQAWDMGLSSKEKDRNQGHSAYGVQDSHRPWEIGTKRQNDTAETKFGDKRWPKSREVRPGTNGATGNRIQVQGTALLENWLFILHKKIKVRNPHSQPASHGQQTLIYQLKICTKEMKNLWVRIIPLFHGLPLASGGKRKPVLSH